jgi:hypothetical protein
MPPLQAAHLAVSTLCSLKHHPAGSFINYVIMWRETLPEGGSLQWMLLNAEEMLVYTVEVVTGLVCP